MIRRVFAVILLLSGIFKGSAQELPPKRELRGVWIATVANIDWPSEQGLSTQAQKLEFTRMLDEHEKTGINALFVQVRPSADAFYAEGREPWSQWLTGEQGQAPSPFYDPLEFMIKEAHKRGMELHAWFNPYRAVFHANGPVAPDHITRRKPEWFFNYDGKKLFNPGIPEAREYIVQVIMDVVRNYDIDGVHFDDYFYPYPARGEHIPDAALYRRYASSGMSLDDWRRENVNLLIRELQDSINGEKPWLKFGISPFGIWKNLDQDFNGSDTDGSSSYYNQFADSRRWLEEGWIDYIVPQIYFPFGHSRAAYDNLVLWWSENSFDKHLYIGLGAYRITEWGNRRQMPRQLNYARKYSEVGGVVFFSSKSLIRNPLGFADSLQANYFHYPALPLRCRGKTI
ncbi:glycoside hydrolase family 10 protein [Anseongella ginsenosidimutans]|uniref:glycoside hydrolase family 10 protein n=1 Tax=Anseongella ginsenosidimutans TaxID=496056 RepID=UPI001CEF9B14|nr:family 10 glycosylhydrolase [Anseongella ginsenosidimutans]